jgi:hypothetical protein
MVGVYFSGRLGNQLFQYYFLLYLKSRNNKLLYFFPNPHHAYLTKYFDLGWYHNLTLGSKLYSVITRCLPKVFKFKTIHFHNFVSPKDVAVSNWSIYHGFFQSDFYFKNSIGNPDISIRKKYREQFDEQYGHIFRENKTVLVHIRRTDYMNYHGRDISLPLDYFQRQLDKIEDIDSYTVFFVSDEIEVAKEYFKGKPNYFFSQNSEIIDFQLIMNADVAIISNSTFSWWAAFLSPKQNKVIAPKNWMTYRIGREHPKGIMTDRFTWVDVLEDSK